MNCRHHISQTRIFARCGKRYLLRLAMIQLIDGENSLGAKDRGSLWPGSGLTSTRSRRSTWGTDFSVGSGLRLATSPPSRISSAGSPTKKVLRQVRFLCADALTNLVSLHCPCSFVCAP